MLEKEMDRRRFLLLATGTIGAVILTGCLRKEEVESISAVVEQATATAVPANTASSEAAAPASPTATTASPTATTASVTAQIVRSACPRGLINDPYPGRCRRYVDRNGNGICDLSEV
jgi:hypothetical protein